MHPDAFLHDLHETYPDTLLTVIGDIAATWRSGTEDDVLASLAVEAPVTAKALQEAR